MTPIRVLVTGAGSTVGQGIVKALRFSSLSVEIVSSDISPLNSALYRTDEAIILPKVESVGSLDRIIKGIKKNKIDVVMIGSEFDLLFFAENKELIEAETGALVLVSPLDTVRLSQDKWLTTEFLRENRLPHAEACIPKDLKDAIGFADELGYPVMIKTRTGSSSRNVHVAKNREHLCSLFDTVPFPMVQKVINIPTQSVSHEFTCSVFKCNDGSLIGPFSARRSLRGGSSWIVEVDQFKELNSLLLSIGEALPITGPLNIQLMLSDSGPVPFEFNTRFSSSTPIRAYFGFNEPDMVLRHHFLGEKLEKPIIRTGLTFRYLEEVFVENATIEQASQYFTKGKVCSWF